MRRPTEAQTQAAKAKRDKIRAMAKRIAGMSQDEQLALTDLTIQTIEGHSLSHFNQMLVACQGCKSPVVGGFNQWRKAGRVVRKGQHGYTIWIPIGASRLDDKSGRTSDDDIHFTLATVFGIDQTDELTAGSTVKPTPKPHVEPKQEPMRFTSSRLAAMAEITGCAA